MSRCFPYPPPVYTLSRAGNDALIESIKHLRYKVIRASFTCCTDCKRKIMPWVHVAHSFPCHVSKTVAIGALKLQKISEKAKNKEQRKKEKEEKKEKKRERKERKKDKKGKDKEKKDKTHQNLDKCGTVFGHGGENLLADTKAGLLHEKWKAESEQVERSSLTEEHGPPLCSQAPSSSSDSTENSNKRKRQCSSADENHVHGKVIRIRLSKKQNDINASVNEQQPCSTSGTSFPSERKEDIGISHRREGPCSKSNETSKINHGLAFRSGGEQIFSPSLGQTAVVTRKVGTSGTPPPMKTALVTPMQRVELQYKNLFENWVVPQIPDPSIDPDDRDWLFHGKNKVAFNKVRQVSGSESSASCSGDQTLWPCAWHLPEVDVYALPFTVPL